MFDNDGIKIIYIGRDSLDRECSRAVHNGRPFAIIYRTPSQTTVCWWGADKVERFEIVFPMADWELDLVLDDIRRIVLIDPPDDWEEE